MIDNIESYDDLKAHFNIFYNELEKQVLNSRDYSKYNYGVLLKITEGVLLVYECIVRTKHIHENETVNYKFQKIIRLLINAIKNKDEVYCSDLLIYEIMPEIKKWKVFFYD